MEKSSLILIQVSGRRFPQFRRMFDFNALAVFLLISRQPPGRLSRLPLFAWLAKSLDLRAGIL